MGYAGWPSDSSMRGACYYCGRPSAMYSAPYLCDECRGIVAPQTADRAIAAADRMPDEAPLSASARRVLVRQSFADEGACLHGRPRSMCSACVAAAAEVIA